MPEEHGSADGPGTEDEVISADGPGTDDGLDSADVSDVSGCCDLSGFKIFHF